MPKDHRIRFWVRRYLPSEISGTIAALVGAWMAFAVTDSFVIAAIAGTIAENVGFYGVAGTRNYLEHRREARALATPPVRRGLIVAAWLTIVEFGPAEFIDTLCVRPAMLFVGPILMGIPAIGWVIGKFAADAVFYAIAGVSYVLSRRAMKGATAR